PFGKPAALIKAAEEVGLIESINKHVGRKKIDGLTPAQYLLMIIIGRSEHAHSRNALEDYFKRSVLQFFWNPRYKLSSQNFLNYMAKLDEETIKKIEIDISRALVKRGLRPTRLIFDTTNFFTYIESGEELPQKGNSKEKRFDKNLIGIGLTTTDHNIPFHSVTYPANENDSHLFSGIIDSICERLQDIDVSAEDIVIVFDRGMNSAENIQKAMEKMHVVGSLPASMCKELYQIPITMYSESWENAHGHVIKAHPVSENWYQTDFNGVLRYNDHTMRKQMNAWNQNKEKIFTKIEEIRTKLGRNGKGRKLTPKGLINRVVDAIPKQYRGLFDYKVVMIEGKPQLDFKLDEVRERDFISSMGKTIIFTDLKGLNSRQIAEIYDSRNQIETDIMWLKDRLLIPLKPTYVRRDVKIRAHVFLCILGLLLYNYTLHIINDSTLTMKQLSHHLDQMRLGLVFTGEENAERRKRADFVIEDMNKSTAEVFTKLQLGQFIPA
ncbi:MAG: IS1634 family transposase, partial [Methanothrix sp.]|nr:IS1634 family transposase [Methanothrix sp.]